MYNNFANQHPNSILALNHEIVPSTVYVLVSSSTPLPALTILNRYEVLPFAIGVLHNAGYNLVTVAECVGQSPYQWVANPQTPGVRSPLSNPVYIQTDLCNHVLTMTTARLALLNPSFLFTRGVHEPKSSLSKLEEVGPVHDGQTTCITSIYPERSSTT